jgi:MarR family transcriptional regulator, organic hydroperoxide resistance regulator
MPFVADSSPADTVARMGRAWRELRRGASAAVVRDRLFGTGRDAVEPGQMDVLDLLVQHDDWRMSELAAALRVDPSTVTRTLQRMEAAGLAIRSPDTGDGRVVVVQPTTEGRRRQALVNGRRTDILNAIMATFDDAEREELIDLLERFIESLDKYVADGAPLDTTS